MNQDQFWQIVDGSILESNDDSDAQIDCIAESLRALSPEEIVHFQTELESRMQAAYTWDLWGAAHVLSPTHSCDDDQFEAFRTWLIGQGREVFENAVSQPDSLFEVTDVEVDEYEFDDLLHVANQVYEERIGEDASIETPSVSDLSLIGSHWDFTSEAECSNRFPQLWSRAVAARSPEALTSA